MEKDSKLLGQKVLLITTGKIIDYSNAHGLCVEVELPKRDFNHDRRIWLDIHEFVIKPETKKKFMIPQTLTPFVMEAKQALSIHGLGHLCNSLTDEKVIKKALREHFNKLDKEDKPIPQELDWIYSQYHTISVAYKPPFPNQNTSSL